MTEARRVRHYIALFTVKISTQEAEGNSEEKKTQKKAKADVERARARHRASLLDL